MSEHDKKVSKNQQDLVQAVLEAHEKSNLDRSDALILNAIKQLKICRLKPDQAIILGLSYLAKICPQAFKSELITEALTSLVKRDSGLNINKAKNEVVLSSVLAANLLIACNNTNTIKLLVIQKVEQWVTTSKTSEMVQNLLATLCCKCNSNEEIVSSLIKLRSHWIEFLTENFEIFDQVSQDLCHEIKKLMIDEKDNLCLLKYIKFLVRHDANPSAFAYDLSTVIVKKPLSFKSMILSENGEVLLENILNFYISTLNDIFRSSIQPPNVVYRKTPIKVEPQKSTMVLRKKIKIENPDVAARSADVKPKLETHDGKPSVKDDYKRYEKYIYVEFPRLVGRAYRIQQVVIEAILNLVADPELNIAKCDDLHNELLGFLISPSSNTVMSLYDDHELTRRTELSSRLKTILILSDQEHLVNLMLEDATISQLISYIQLFGVPKKTAETIFQKLDVVLSDMPSKVDLQVEQYSYMDQLIQYYLSLNINSGKHLSNCMKKMFTKSGEV